MKLIATWLQSAEERRRETGSVEFEDRRKEKKELTSSRLGSNDLESVHDVGDESIALGDEVFGGSHGSWEGEKEGIRSAKLELEVAIDQAHLEVVQVERELG